MCSSHPTLTIFTLCAGAFLPRISSTQCVSTFPASSDLLFLFDPLYSHAEEILEERLKSRFANAVVARILVPSKGEGGGGGGDEPSKAGGGDVLSKGDGSDDGEESVNGEIAVTPTDPFQASSDGKQEAVNFQDSTISEVCRRKINIPAGKKMEDFKVVFVGTEGMNGKWLGRMDDWSRTHVTPIVCFFAQDPR